MGGGAEKREGAGERKGGVGERWGWSKNSMDRLRDFTNMRLDSGLHGSPECSALCPNLHQSLQNAPKPGVCIGENQGPGQTHLSGLEGGSNTWNCEVIQARHSIETEVQIWWPETTGMLEICEGFGRGQRASKGHGEEGITDFT